MVKLAVAFSVCAVAALLMFLAPPTRITGNQHPMYTRYAMTGQTSLINNAVVPVPYHNYHSFAFLIHGLADVNAVKNLIKGQFEPVTLNGKAIISLWVVDYFDTNINPYEELVITFLVKNKGLEDDHECKSIHCVNVLQSKAGYHQYVWKLWLDEQLPIDYGRELLGCDKYMADIKIEQKNINGTQLTYSFVENGELLMKGKNHIVENPLEQVQHLPSLIQELGVRNALLFLLHPPEFIQVSAVTPPGVANIPDSEKYNPIWLAHFQTEPKFAWAPGNDDIEIGEPLKMLDFEAVLYQWDDKLGAILMPPHVYQSL